MLTSSIGQSCFHYIQTKICKKVIKLNSSSCHIFLRPCNILFIIFWWKSLLTMLPIFRLQLQELHLPACIVLSIMIWFRYLNLILSCKWNWDFNCASWNHCYCTLHDWTDIWRNQWRAVAACGIKLVRFKYRHETYCLQCLQKMLRFTAGIQSFKSYEILVQMSFMIGEWGRIAHTAVTSCLFLTCVIR